jgi:hypothetical protein
MTVRNRVRRGFLIFNLGISFKERRGVSPAVMGLLTQSVLWSGSVGRAVSVESIDEIVAYCAHFHWNLMSPGWFTLPSSKFLEQGGG